MSGAALALVVTSALASLGPAGLGDEALETGAERFLGAEAYVEAPLPSPASEGVVLSPAVRPHALARVRWIQREALVGGDVEVDYNTDTLLLAWRQAELFGPRTWFTAFAKAEAVYAGLLSDHAAAGEQDLSRAYAASYGQVGVTGSVEVARARGGGVWLETVVTGRQWLFLPLPGTSTELRLPPNLRALEIGLGVRGALTERRTRLRWTHGVSGFARGEGHIRYGARGFGGLGDKPDARNLHRTDLPVLAQAGVEGRFISEPLFAIQLRPVVEAAASAGQGVGLDDLNRFRVGGENRYAVPLAGAGWAEFLADRYGQAHVAGGLVVRERFGLLVGLEVASVNDPLRAGHLDAVGVMAGALIDMEWAVLDGVFLRARVSQGFGLPRVEGDRGMKGALGLAWEIW